MKQLKTLTGALAVIVLLVAATAAYQVNQLQSENMTLRQENELLAESVDAFKQENQTLREQVFVRQDIINQIEAQNDREFYMEKTE